MKFKQVFLLLLLWAAWGFTLGTLALLGPLRWTVNWGRSQQWTEGQEKLRVYILIIVLLIASFLLARAAAATLLNQQRSRLRLLWLLLPMLGAGFSVYAFMNPKWVNSGKDEMVAKQITIGPYPELEKLQALKKENYTVVVSLLHPAVLPFEPQLIKQELNSAKAAGLKMISIPMLPWISENSEAIDSLRKVVRNTSGKVYIHCYLGKDRVNIARRIIEQELEKASVEGQGFHFRQLDTVQRLERGPVYQLEKGVFLTPFPTKEEYVGYVLAANFQQVVSLANLSEPGAKDLMDEEAKLLGRMKIPFKVYPVSSATSAAEMQKVAAEIKQMQKPLLIHPFFSDSKEAKLLMQLYK